MKELMPTPPGEISFFNDIAPETIRAQRMAELEQMAKYRAQKLEYYRLWAEDPEKAVEVIQNARQKAGDEIVKGLDTGEYKWVAWRDDLKLKPIIKEPLKTKLKWHQKAWKWICDRSI